LGGEKKELDSGPEFGRVPVPKRKGPSTKHSSRQRDPEETGKLDKKEKREKVGHREGLGQKRRRPSADLQATRRGKRGIDRIGVLCWEKDLFANERGNGASEIGRAERERRKDREATAKLLLTMEFGLETKERPRAAKKKRESRRQPEKYVEA